MWLCKIPCNRSRTHINTICLSLKSTILMFFHIPYCSCCLLHYRLAKFRSYYVASQGLMGNFGGINFPSLFHYLAHTSITVNRSVAIDLINLFVVIINLILRLIFTRNLIYREPI